MFVTFHWSYGMPYNYNKYKLPLLVSSLKSDAKEGDPICICLCSETHSISIRTKYYFDHFPAKKPRVSVNRNGIVVYILWFPTFHSWGNRRKTIQISEVKYQKQQRQKLVYHLQFAMGFILLQSICVRLFWHCFDSI